MQKISAKPLAVIGGGCGEHFRLQPIVVQSNVSSCSSNNNNSNKSTSDMNDGRQSIGLVYFGPREQTRSRFGFALRLKGKGSNGRRDK